MLPITTTAKTAMEFRDQLVEELKRRERVCRLMAESKSRSRKGVIWETGRADCYRDLVEFLNSISAATSPAE